MKSMFKKFVVLLTLFNLLSLYGFSQGIQLSLVFKNTWGVYDRLIHDNTIDNTLYIYMFSRWDKEEPVIFGFLKELTKTIEWDEYYNITGTTTEVSMKWKFLDSSVFTELSNCATQVPFPWQDVVYTSFEEKDYVENDGMVIICTDSMDQGFESISYLNNRDRKSVV